VTKQFAILRVEKVKSFAAIASMGRHWLRTQRTFNSIKERRKFNKVLKGTGDVSRDLNVLLKRKNITKFRKNGVIALEFVLTFSPDYIYQNDKGQLRSDAKPRVNLWLKSSLKWLDNNFGENCTSIVYHGDESTPHIHVVVAPIKAKANGLNGLCAKDITGGRQKLRALQDSYHNEVKCCGLARGVRRETPKSHQSLKDFYSSIYHIEKKLHEQGLTSVENSDKVNVFEVGIDKIVSEKNKERTTLFQKMEQIIKHLMSVNQTLKDELKLYRNSPKFKL
jgi:hypothetical protein